MNLALLIKLIYSTAALPIFYFLAKVARALFLANDAKRNGIERRARIVGVRVLNEVSRRIPFVKLKVEIFGEEGIADAEGFYSPQELAALKIGTMVWVRCRPWAGAPLQVVKKPVRLQNATRVEKNEVFISVKTGQVQSRATHRHRLAFQ